MYAKAAALNRDGDVVRKERKERGKEKEQNSLAWPLFFSCTGLASGLKKGRKRALVEFRAVFVNVKKKKKFGLVSTPHSLFIESVKSKTQANI